jgi:hypothetical protein
MRWSILNDFFAPLNDFFTPGSVTLRRATHGRVSGNTSTTCRETRVFRMFARSCSPRACARFPRICCNSRRSGITRILGTRTRLGRYVRCNPDHRFESHQAQRRIPHSFRLFRSGRVAPCPSPFIVVASGRCRSLWPLVFAFAVPLRLPLPCHCVCRCLSRSPKLSF